MMLGLKLPTDPRWVNLAEITLEDILTDHAYCEQKAATSCISLIQSYPDKIALVEALAPIVTEEWGHFRLVLAELKTDSTAGNGKDEYVNALINLNKKADQRPVSRTLTYLRLNRSKGCGFRLLHSSFRRKTKNFIMAYGVEAGHYRLFIDLASHIRYSNVKDRWQDYGI
jgi:tRNA-(ms[2]io[6]A)-hydroxylase